MSAFRFVDTADIHLDSPLRSLALRNPGLADLIGNATRQALIRHRRSLPEEQVDALLIAGDLYDGDQTSMKTARFLASRCSGWTRPGLGFHHSRQSRCPVEDHPGAGSRSVKVFGGRAEAVESMSERGERRFVHPWPELRQAPCARKPARPIPPACPGAVNIGLMHTSLDGRRATIPTRLAARRPRRSRLRLLGAWPYPSAAQPRPPTP